MDAKLRDLAIFSAIGYVLVDDWGVDPDELLTMTRRANMDALDAELLPETDAERQAVFYEIYEEYARKLALGITKEAA